jgi:antitoxin FitA
MSDDRSQQYMASITIRNLGERTKAQLRIRAAHHRRSMEAEARNILHRALSEKAIPAVDLATSIRERFAAIGGIDLALAPREPMRNPPRPRS